MEFQQLEMFAAVVEEGGVSRAAERVFRTAAAVSIALTKLEEELGVAFFDRSDRQQPELTQSGRLLYSYARRILELRLEARTVIKHGEQRRRSKLRLGAHESTSLYLLPRLLQTFNKNHPEIKTEIVCGNSENILKALANGSVDLALMGDAPEEPAYDRHLIAHDRLVLIVNPAHRLGTRKEVSVRDLSDEFLIVQSFRSKLRKRLAEAFLESDSAFNIGIENIAIEATKHMVIDNLGIGFIPSMCVEEEVREGKLNALSVNGVRSDWDLSLVRRRDKKQSVAARLFFDETKDMSPSYDIALSVVA